MTLLDLDSGRLSLEFDAAERDAVRQALAGIGEVELTAHATHTLLRVAGEELIYLDEWGEPCLIAHTAGGAALLRRLAGARPQARVA